MMIGRGHPRTWSFIAFVLEGCSMGVDSRIMNNAFIRQWHPPSQAAVLEYFDGATTN
jgi:hypothetical protein